MKKIMGACLHRIGWNLSALAMRLDPSEGREHIAPNKICFKMFCLGGFLESRGNELMVGK